METLTQKKYRESHKEECYKRTQDWYKKHPEKRTEYNKKFRLKLREEVISHYGNCRCACCGETNFGFLTIDHIGGGGNKHKKRLGLVTVGFYAWLKRNDYPKGYRVLCYNCNCGIAFNRGICPHKKGRK
jgi:hypothetical protein